ncbi:MAG: peptide deformylase [Candidatus Sericytochromatia bacterium]|nr:peptide deformylase [Candidatus Tanganyikabacteria bacterium]
MATLPLSYLGEDVLRRPAEPVKKVSEDIRRLVEEMYETCAAEHGVGLAAPQVGVAKRVIVLDLSHLDIEPFCLINPVVKRRYGPLEADAEGCLSIPGVFMDVTRHRDVVVEGRDIKGRIFKVDATDLLARAIQHEVDHLEGKLFIDMVDDKAKLEEELAALEGRLVEIRAGRWQGLAAGVMVG